MRYAKRQILSGKMVFIIMDSHRRVKRERKDVVVIKWR